MRPVCFSLVAAGLFTLTACKSGAPEPSKLIPEGATLMGAVDIHALTGTSLWKDAQSKNEEEAKKTLDALTACNVGLDKWKTLTFGADPKGGEDKMVVVVVAEGLGKKANLECLVTKTKELGSDKEVTLGDEGGKVTISVKDVPGTGIVVDDNTVAFAGTSWKVALNDLLAKKGTAAVDGTMKDLYARAPKGKSIWFAGTIPADMAQGPVEGAKDVVASLDFASGLAIDAQVGFANAEDAKKKQEELAAMWNGFKDTVKGFGLPDAVVNSVKIEGKESAMSLSVSASEADLKAIADKAGSMMGGMMGGAPEGES